MKPSSSILVSLLAAALMFTSCTKKIKVLQDQIYSRHLQTHIKLTILSTPIPENKSELNLLLLNDGQDIDQLKLRDVMTDLYKKKLIRPLVVVAIHATNRNDIYGVAGYPDYQGYGARADKYAAFVDDELYPYVKKNAGVRKFSSVVMAGTSLGGLSAFDIAWNHSDKIDKVGVFSGSFWWRDKDANAPDYSDSTDRIVLKNIRSSRKKPHLKYWFYVGDREETADRDKDGIIDAVDDTRDLVALIKSKNVCAPGDIEYTEAAEGRHDPESWSKVLPDFLLWAFGK